MVAALVGALNDEDAVIRMRAADALEKVSRSHADLVCRFAPLLLRLAANSGQQEVRWHLAQMMPRLQLSAKQRACCVHTLTAYLEDRSSIVRTCALQALAELAVIDRRLRRTVNVMLLEARQHGSPAMRARAKRILAMSPMKRGDRCRRR